MRFSAAQKNRLYGEIAKLLRAGFSIDTAAEAILKRRTPATARRYLEGLREGLARRCTIGESVAESGIDVTPLEVSLVVAGERGGRLEESYENLASYFGMLDRTGKRIRAGLIYPIVLLHVAVLLPPIPKAILAGDPAQAGRSIVATLLVLYLFTAVAAAGGVRAAKAARDNVLVDLALGVIPLIGKVRRSLALARFCRVFHIHLLAALPVTAGLRAGGEASQSGRVRRASAATADRVEGGSTLSEGLQDEPAFPADLVSSLYIAELSGTLDLDLERWSRDYHESATEALEAAGGWVPKMIYALVALYVAWQILSMGLAYIGALEGYLGA